MQEGPLEILPKYKLTAVRRRGDMKSKLKEEQRFGFSLVTKILSKNVPKSSPQGSKWRPKSILEASWEAKLKRRRFLMPRGRLKDLFWGAMWESKIVPNPSQKRFQDAYVIEEHFGTGLAPTRD